MTNDAPPIEIEWMDLKRADPTIGLDLRYATDANFLNRVFYPTPEAFLHRAVAEDFLRAHGKLRERGLGFLVFDAYRPLHVTRQFWELARPGMHDYLADPATGSNHNRGCAIDCALYDLRTGRPLPMPSDFDEMNERAWVAYAGGTSEERANRTLLIETLSAVGFEVAPNEWWHFNHPLRKRLPVYDLSFAEIAERLRLRD